MKVFRQKGIHNANGKLLPYSEFRLFSDISSPEIPKEKGERIVRYAEGLLGRDIPLLPASVYRQYVTIGNRSNYEDIYFLRRDMAVAFAVAEAYENKGRFIEKLMDVVWAIMEESTWIIPAHIYCAPLHGDSSLGPVFGDNSLHGIDLFSAGTAGTLASVYLLCKDKLDAIDPVICRKMEYCLKERAIKNFLQIEVWWGGATGARVNNWCPWIDTVLIAGRSNGSIDHFCMTKCRNNLLCHKDLAAYGAMTALSKTVRRTGCFNCRINNYRMSESLYNITQTFRFR